jgi:hypothetical protein
MTPRGVRRWSFSGVCVLVAGSLWGLCLTAGLVAESPASSAPAAWTSWGTDHVGATIPDYVTGEECLFCHRDNWGNEWSRNFHERTVRAVDPASPAMDALKSDAATNRFAGEIEFLLGDRRRIRYLKRTGDYGKLALLSAAFNPPPPGSRSRRVHGKISESKDVHWDAKTFAQSCAGCHMTAVDPETHAFAAISLDCYTCHGVVDLKHSKDTTRILFGKGRHDPPQVSVAVCAQCHLRTGKSRKTGLPYPTNFVAGDNLFRDFQVDLSDAALAAMNPGDRHVAQNVREVLDGKSRTTCVSCHNIHKQSAAGHRQVARDATCVICHEPNKPMSKPIRYEVHSALCEY